MFFIHYTESLPIGKQLAFWRAEPFAKWNEDQAAAKKSSCTANRERSRKKCLIGKTQS